MIADDDNLTGQLNELQQRYDQLWQAYLSLLNETREHLEMQHERFRTITEKHWMPK